ncbi:MAG: response regulator, partial [Candidatus Latescibacteria bacterium]|nr:response regulator [Candidatus Latescibacterota bacterium]
AGAYASVTRWGGRLDLDSTPNKGTTAIVHLPIWTQHDAKADQDIIGSTRAGNILIVEDESIVRSFLTRALSSHHQVDAESNGRKGLAQFSKKTYDVVLVDLGMPDLPGDQVIAQMRRTAPNVSAILITGWQLSKDDPRYLAFDFHLQKPFDSVSKITTLVAQAIQAYDNKQANL